MKWALRLSMILLCAMPFAHSIESARGEEEPRVAVAKVVLADYWAKETRNARVLHVAYFCPADRTPAPQYQERLTRILEDISAFYTAQFQHYNLACDGIPFERSADGRLVIHLVQGTQPAADYSEAKSAGEIKRDVEKVMSAACVAVKSNHVVVFTRLGNYDGTKTSHNSPYCGAGDCRNGFCWQFDSDILDTHLLPKTTPFVDDKQYGHINLGRYNSIFIGGTAHELGHLFGLPHNATTPENLKGVGHSLMGDGNRHYHEELQGAGKGSFIPLADALMLCTNPLFSRVDKGLSEKWQSSIVDPAFDTSVAGRFKITGHYTSNQPIYGVVAYVNPNVKDDHGAVSYLGTLGADNSFSIDVAAPPAPKGIGDVRIILLSASGQHLSAYAGTRAPFRQPYAMGVDKRITVGEPGQK